jgi:hypothetical protein
MAGDVTMGSGGDLRRYRWAIAPPGGFQPVSRGPEYVPSDTQKMAIVPHIRYEMEQLAGTTCTVPRTESEVNIQTEARLIHVRVLRDFFERTTRTVDRRGAQNDDVLCSDLDFRPRSLQLPNDARDRLNRRLAHLSYFRCDVTPEGATWRRAAIVLPVLRRSREFAHHMLESKWMPDDDERQRWGLLISQLDAAMAACTKESP